MATGATTFLTLATQDEFIPENWSPIILDERENNLVYVSICDQQFKIGMKMGDVLHVNDLPNLTARAKTAETAILYETVVHSQTDITIDQFYYAAIAVEKVTDVQAMNDQATMFAPKMGYALALQEDNTLAGLPDDLTTNTVGTLNTATTVDNWIQAVRLLMDQNAPNGGNDWNAVVSPREWANLIKQDFFVRSDYTASIGNFSAAARRGYFGSVLGVNFYQSTNVEGSNTIGHDNCLLHRSCLTLARQLSPSVESQYDIDYLAQKVVAFEMFGTQTMRETHGVWVKGL